MRTVAFAGLTGALLGVAAVARESRRQRERRAWRRRYDRHIAGHQGALCDSRDSLRSSRPGLVPSSSSGWGALHAA